MVKCHRGQGYRKEPQNFSTKCIYKKRNAQISHLNHPLEKIRREKLKSKEAEGIINIKAGINEREKKRNPKAGALKAIKLNVQEWITREWPRWRIERLEDHLLLVAHQTSTIYRAALISSKLKI